MKRNRYKLLALWLSLIAVMLSPLLASVGNASAAALPALDEIRVALFIDARGTVPAVTLAASGGLRIGARDPGGTRIWVSEAGGAKFASDQYYVEAARTPDYAAANGLYARLRALASGTAGAHLFREPGLGGAVFVPAAGPYATLQEAEAAKSVLQSQIASSAAQWRVTGPRYWNAGSYPDAGQAEALVQQLNEAGLSAHLAIQQPGSGQQPVYSAWIGGAHDEASMNSVKNSALQQFPQLQLIAADTGQAYLVKRWEASESAQAPAPMYLFSASAGQKVWVTSDAPVQVRERYERSYRGSMEISLYNGGLALINEVPLEQYVASVVGGEMGGNWPLEALKAQAVAARSYALSSGMKYGIAHVSDTTYDQVYKGIGTETAAVLQAVEQTRGEVLVRDGTVINALYYSNAGGMTAVGEEAWGREVPFAAAMPSPDHNAQEGLLAWNRVVLQDGTVGYVRSDFTRDTGLKNTAGFPILESTGSGVNVRRAPFVDNTSNAPIAKLELGDRMVKIGEDPESNPYSWIYGPYSGAELQNSILARTGLRLTGSLTSLEVADRGPSGRVMSVRANGAELPVSYPDAYRTVLMGIPSTRFDIEQMGRFTVLGAGGNTVAYPEESAGTLHAVSAGRKAAPVSRDAYVLAVNADGEARVLSLQPAYRFMGLGFGHGVGMSQYGAKEMAEFMGYDYHRILQYYYNGATLAKIESSAQDVANR